MGILLSGGMASMLAAVHWHRIAACFALAAAAVFAIGFPARVLGQRTRILDQPGERSSHTVPVPRTGGLAIILGVFFSLLMVVKPSLAFLVAAGIGGLVVAISMADDVISIPALPRLGVHLLVAALTVWLVRLALHDLGLPYLHVAISQPVGLVLAVLFAVAVVNFFNFMDGINGIAVTQGLLGGLTICLLLIQAGGGNSVLTAAALAGGCLGFLPHNFPRARMFMGDVGSTTLGFAMAMLVLVGAGRTGLPFVAYMLPLGVFIYDATFTIIKRTLRGENPLRAHREHHYQLLVRCGWSHARVTLLNAALMALHCVGALIYANAGDAVRLGVLCVLLGTDGAYSVLVHAYFRRHGNGQPATAAARAPAGAKDVP